MSDGQEKLTRQQLYEKIRETSKDEYILSEMQRLGFWPKDNDAPTLTEEFVTKRSALLKQLRDVGRDYQLYQDPAKALAALHKERKKEALIRREQKRKERNQQRFERAQRWYETQQTDITYIGDGYSHGLKNSESDLEKVEANDLPVLRDAQELSQAMGITVNELRFLTYHKAVRTVDHYQRFEMVKKSGGTRLISAPMPRLKRAQYWVLTNVLEPLALHDAAHGFVAERSIVSNAAEHVGQSVVINLDLQDFFPTISYPRLKGLFQSLGYSEHIATLLSLLCTQSPAQELELDGQTWFVSDGERVLPQGAPTSPAISNLLCRRLDNRLAGMAKKLGFHYTRYADDLTFSAKDIDDRRINQLLWRCRAIVSSEGFIVHPKKTRIMRKHQQQEVTGVVVNDKLNVDRKTLKRFRALLHQIEKDGPEGKQWGNGELFATIEGYANYVAMVNPEKGLGLKQKVLALKKQYGYQTKPSTLRKLNKQLMRVKSAKGEPPREPWWQAQPPAPPAREKTAEEITIDKKNEKIRESMAQEPRAERIAERAQPRVHSNRSTEDQERRDQGQPRPDTKGAGNTMLMIAIIIFVILVVMKL